MKRIIVKSFACLVAVGLLCSHVGMFSNVASAKKKASVKVSSVKVSNVKSKSVSLYVGETFKLKYKVVVKPNKTKNKKVVFKSSNAKVAKVNAKGVITAKKKGTAKITVTSVVNKSKKAIVKVTVKKPVKVKSISLSDSVLAIDEDDEDDYQLSYTVAPANATDKSVEWYSSDEDVVYVDEDGFLYTMGEGTATVTVKAMDGSGVKDTCQVIVEASDDYYDDEDSDDEYDDSDEDYDDYDDYDDDYDDYDDEDYDDEYYE